MATDATVPVDYLRTSYFLAPQVTSAYVVFAESIASVKVLKSVVPRTMVQVAGKTIGVIIVVLHGSVTLKVKITDGWKFCEP